MAIVDGLIVHDHYAKPMASLEVTLGRSAMSKGSKYNILVQEGCRRLRNMSPSSSWDSKVPHINKLMIQMAWAGYTFKDREIVATRILAKYDTDIRNYTTEGKNIYRSKTERQNDIKATKSTWFRELGATATIKVPMTNNSALAKQLREVLVKFPGPKGTTTKVVEQPGIPILSGLSNSNPFKTIDCNKGQCP